MHKQSELVLCFLLLVFSWLAHAQESKSLLRAADSLYMAGNFAASAKFYERAIRAGEARSRTSYSAARAFALAGDKEQAWHFLNQSIDWGWRHIQFLEKDNALVSLNEDPRWEDILNKTRVAKNKFAPVDSVIDRMNRLSAEAYLYRIRPKSMGGGGKSYTGFEIPANLRSFSYGSFEARVIHSDTIFFIATSAVVKGTIETKMDRTGRLGIGGWRYTDGLKVLVESQK